MANKIAYADKVGLKPKTVRINQIWDDDMNEIKYKHNLNDDRITELEGSSAVTGVLGYTPIAGGYLAFGGTVKIDDDTIHHYVRIGDDHVGGWGDIYKIVYDISSDTWGGESLVYAASGLDSRNLTVGYVGSDIFIFFARYIFATSTWQDAGYIKSSNKGVSWSSYTILHTAVVGGYFCGGGFGAMCSTSVATTYLMSAYWYDTTGDTFKWGFYKTTDTGATWTETIVNSGLFSAYEAEPSYAYIGNSRIVCVVRLLAGGSDLWHSANNGTSWTKVGKLPFSVSAAATVASIFYNYNSNKIIGQWLDRNVNKFYTCIGDADDIYYNIYGFKNIRISDRDASNAKNGYATFANLETTTGDNKDMVLCVYSHEFSDSSSKLYQIKIQV